MPARRLRQAGPVFLVRSAAPGGASRRRSGLPGRRRGLIGPPGGVSACGAGRRLGRAAAAGAAARPAAAGCARCSMATAKRHRAEQQRAGPRRDDQPAEATWTNPGQPRDPLPAPPGRGVLLTVPARYRSPGPQLITPSWLCCSACCESRAGPLKGVASRRRLA